jgi:hypothetical protein
MFTRESLLSSEWYAERLRTKQQRDIALWRRHVHALEQFRSAGLEFPPQDGAGFEIRSALARTQLARVTSPAYLDELIGTIAADPFHDQIIGDRPA